MCWPPGCCPGRAPPRAARSEDSRMAVSPFTARPGACSANARWSRSFGWTHTHASFCYDAWLRHPIFIVRRVAALIPARAGTDTPAKQGSISFLKKRNKKLLLCWLTLRIRLARIEASKSFLVLFFKKELLSWHLRSFGSESFSMRVGIGARSFQVESIMF